MEARQDRQDKEPQIPRRTAGSSGIRIADGPPNRPEQEGGESRGRGAALACRCTISASGSRRGPHFFRERAPHYVLLTNVADRDRHAFEQARTLAPKRQAGLGSARRRTPSDGQTCDVA